jgi:hypothetical protein
MLAILSAVNYCDIGKLQAILRELGAGYLDKAYEQYLARVPLSEQAELSQNDFKGLPKLLLRIPEMNRFLKELNRVLGAVPD